MLKHHSPAKSGHSIYKKNTCGTCAFVSFICDASHRGTGIHLLHKTRGVATPK